MDLAHLEALLRDPQYRGRPRIGSFSAASNVTGMRSPVTAPSHGSFAGTAPSSCIDYAASGPYVGST